MAKNSSSIDLSIVVPVFNEEEGIEKAIIEIFRDSGNISVKNLLKTFEVIIVNDGSWDNTDKILQKLKKRYRNIIIVKHKVNQGLGASIKTGIKLSSKKFVTYLPADGQVFLREITEGIKLAPLADLILTYRGRKADYNSYRHLLSNSLRFLMKLLFNLKFKDYNWVHIYKRSLLKSINVKSNGVFYLAEVVARTNNRGFKILETQAKYHPRSTGYSKNARPLIVLRTLIDLFKLWIEFKI